MNVKYFISRGLAVFAVSCGMAGRVSAVPTFFIVQEDTRFTQTGPSTTTGDGFVFLGRATPNDGIGPIDFNGGSISFPAASPLSPATLSPVGAELQYNSGKIDQPTFQADYPGGNYTFHLTDSSNASHTQTETVNSTIVTTPATIPMLSASSFNALQGANASQPITVTFNSFADANPNALIFFAIQDSLGNTPLFDGLQPNVTQDTIPANTLQTGTQYSFFLFFDNIAITPDNNGEVLLDNRTRGAFATAAVPEPGVALPSLLVIWTASRVKRRKAIPRVDHESTRISTEKKTGRRPRPRFLFPVFSSPPPSLPPGQ